MGKNIKKLEKSFPRVYVEISGICNAKCPYCVTGAQNQPQGKFIDLKLFRRILEYITDKGIFDKNTGNLWIYKWGEPFLHPEFSDIIHIINDFEINYMVSTNGSIVPEITPSMTKYLKTLYFSMPGFSQYSYDKIHGFSFEKIKENITAIVNKLKGYGYNKEITILYHIYRFNMKETELCKEFASKLGINIFPYYAGIMDFWQQIALIEGTMEKEQLNRLSCDYFLDYYYAFFSMKKKRCKLPAETFAIDEYGNVGTCCQIPANHPDYLCGNLFKDELQDILKKKFSRPFCTTCKDYGMAFDDSWNHSFDMEY